MKSFVKITFIISLFNNTIYSQNVGINTNGAAPDASALLDIASTAGGLLIPRMTLAQRADIPLRIIPL